MHGVITPDERNEIHVIIRLSGRSNSAEGSVPKPDREPFAAELASATSVISF